MYTGSRLVSTYHVGGVSVQGFSRASFAKQLLRDASAKLARPLLVFSMNGEGISKFHTDPVFRAAIEAADYVHADGASVVRAGNQFNGAKSFPERVATTDAFHDAALLAERCGLTFYFLGARQTANSQAVEAARRLYPGLRILGAHHGYFRDNSEEELNVLEEIARLKPDVVWVALGRPRQELWCLRHRDQLRGVAWLKTCGGLFDFLSGRAHRAPQFMIDAGFEWLYRLLREPRRLFWRYLVTNVHSIYLYIRFQGRPLSRGR